MDCRTTWRLLVFDSCHRMLLSNTAHGVLGSSSGSSSNFSLEFFFFFSFSFTSTNITVATHNLCQSILLNNRRGDNSRKIAMNTTNCALLTMYKTIKMKQFQNVHEKMFWNSVFLIFLYMVRSAQLVLFIAKSICCSSFEFFALLVFTSSLLCAFNKTHVSSNG